MNVFTEAFKAMWRRKWLLLLNLAAWPAAAALGWWWLGFAEETGLKLVVSAVSALVILGGLLWVQAATLAAFREAGAVPWMPALRRVPLVFLWSALMTAAAWAASRYVTQQWLRTLASVALLALAWPAASRLASRVRGLLSVYADWRYWAALGAAFFAGVIAALRILNWVPRVEGLGPEFASFAARLFVAFVLGLASWLWVAAVIGVLVQFRREPVAEPAQHGPEPAVGNPAS